MLDKNTKLKIIIIISFFVICLLYVLNPYKLVNYLLYLIFPLFCVMAGFYAYSRYGHKNKQGKAILYISMGFLLVFISESLSVYYKYIIGNISFPAPQDYLYSIALVLLLIGVIGEVIAIKIKIRTTFIYILTISFIILALTVGFAIFDSTKTLSFNVFNILHRIIQLSLLFSLFFLYLISKEYQSGKFSKPWLYIFIGTVFNVIAGMILGIYILEYRSQVQPYITIIDMFWIVGYITAGYGFINIGFMIEDIKKDVRMKIKMSGIISNMKK